MLPLSVSQNFLTSRCLLYALLRKTSLTADDTVVEIGAGKGHLTRALAQRAGRVIAYELDPALCAKLRGSLPENVRLIEGDFLLAKLPEGPYSVCANIPFSRTTEIFRKLVFAPNPPQSVWLCVEKGAAMRFCGMPRETVHSLALRPFFHARILHTFRREDFHPAPRVDCVFLELKRKADPDLPLKDRAAFAAFVRACGAHGFSWKSAGLTKKQISTALRLAKLPPLAPNGEVLYVQWLCLFRCWQRFGKPFKRGQPTQQRMVR